MGLEEFGANPSWCFRFMKRHRLSVRCTTACGQKLPDNWEDKVQNFQTYVRELISEGQYPPCKIGNMDEVPVTFDVPNNRTVNEVGEKTVRVTTWPRENQFYGSSQLYIRWDQAATPSHFQEENNAKGKPTQELCSNM